MAGVKRGEDSILSALDVGSERPVRASFARRCCDFCFHFFVVRVLCKQLDVLDRLEHGGLAAVGQLVNAIFFVDDTLVDDVLDGP